MKDKNINIRLSSSLYYMLQFKSASANLKVSDYVRTLIIKNEVKFNNKKDVGKLIGAINRVGNNLNQIAHGINKVNVINKNEKINCDEILEELIYIENLLQEFLRDL